MVLSVSLPLRWPAASTASASALLLLCGGAKRGSVAFGMTIEAVLGFGSLALILDFEQNTNDQRAALSPNGLLIATSHSSSAATRVPRCTRFARYAAALARCARV